MKSYLTLAHIPYSTAGGTWLVDRHVYTIIEQQRAIGNQLEARINFKTGSIQHHTVLGLDAITTNNTADRNISLLDLTSFFHPTPDITGQKELLLLNKIGTHIEQWLLAPYFVYYIDLSEDLSIFMGGRLDVINMKGDRLNNSFDYIQKVITSKPESVSKRYTKFNPMFALSFRDSEQLRFYFNFGKAFAQSATSLNEPELSTQWEFGYKYLSPNERLQHTFSVFQIRKENMTIPIVGPLQGDIREPEGSQQSRGIEVDFFARIFDRLYAQLNYAYIQAEYINYTEMSVTPDLTTELLELSDSAPPFVPGHLLNIWIFNYFANGLGIGIGTSYTGSQYVHADNDFQLSGYFIFNAALIYRFEQGGWKTKPEQFYRNKVLFSGIGPIYHSAGPALNDLYNIILPYLRLRLHLF